MTPHSSARVRWKDLSRPLTRAARAQIGANDSALSLGERRHLDQSEKNPQRQVPANEHGNHETEEMKVGAQDLPFDRSVIFAERVLCYSE